MEGGCVITPIQRQAVLKLLHEGHSGASRMKVLARRIVWWPRTDLEVERMVKSCNACQVTRKKEPRFPLHPWEWIAKP